MAERKNPMAGRKLKSGKSSTKRSPGKAQARPAHPPGRVTTPALPAYDTARQSVQTGLALGRQAVADFRGRQAAPGFPRRGTPGRPPVVILPVPGPVVPPGFPTGGMPPPAMPDYPTPPPPTKPNPWDFQPTPGDPSGGRGIVPPRLPRQGYGQGRGQGRQPNPRRPKT